MTDAKIALRVGTPPHHRRIVPIALIGGAILTESVEPQGVTRDKEVITYCRIGERSSHTWFVLKYLLGYPDVRNLCERWTEWRNFQRTRFGMAG